MLFCGFSWTKKINYTNSANEHCDKRQFLDVFKKLIFYEQNSTTTAKIFTFFQLQAKIFR